MRIAVVGAGAVGARAARQLASTDGVEKVVVHEPDPQRLRSVLDGLTEDRSEPGRGDPGAGVDAVVLGGPSGDHAALAARLVGDGRHVVSTSDELGDVRALLALDDMARAAGRAVVVGAGFSPGLTCLLASHVATGFDAVDEIHVAKVGTGGPACARQHHDALAGAALDWRDGEWVDRPGGSGRELCWFPEPIGGADCYRAALPDALLLHAAFPGVRRVTARVGATRRDRLTARLPMLRRPHPEGMVGAVRVEVRGERRGARAVEVVGVLDRPGIAAGAVAALAAVAAVRGELARDGAAGLAELADALPLLRELSDRGVRAAVFEGVG